MVINLFLMLNENYYNTLIDKYSTNQDCNKLISLTTNVILNNYSSKNVYFNFPKGFDLKEIINLLYEDLSKQIFSNHADLTDYSVGNKLKRKNEKSKNIYIIKDILDSRYFLTIEKDDSNLIITSTFDNLKRNFIQIQQNSRTSTLLKYNDFFKEVNSYGFLPTHFSKKLVLIAGQTMWGNLEHKNCIPSIYLPNTREEEQTVIKSIFALEDSIAYITPKYDVCYEELLKKNVEVDTIIICGTDLNCLSQIINDQSKYKFKLILLSNENEMQQINNITLWNWQKEEISLTQAKPNGPIIDINEIANIELEKLFQIFESAKRYVSTELDQAIKLSNYGYYVRLAFNALQEEGFDYALYRLKTNKELENNEGGYDINFFGEKNPKEALKRLIELLKDKKYKINKIRQLWEVSNKKIIIIADREDIDFLKKQLNTTKNILTYTELKKLLNNDDYKTKTLLFYSFDGSKKEFDFLYNLFNNIKLVLYSQERDLYFSQLQYHKTNIEKELTSNDRFTLCRIKYVPIAVTPVKVSPTLEDILKKLDESSQKTYDNYKDESDSLLDETEEQITYRVTLSNSTVEELESNETVFDSKGNLIKAFKLQVNKRVRIYSKEQLPEELLQIAMAEEPEIFGKVKEHSTFWQNALSSLGIKYKNNREKLYSLLKQNGLRVLPSTVDAYFRGNSKFPMFNRDLKAILELSNNLSLFNEIKKSKKLYNNTMIALGRGIKQELKQFLQEKTLGEILCKKNFTKETLQRFIEDKMPLLTITKIEEVCDEQ